MRRRPIIHRQKKLPHLLTRALRSASEWGHRWAGFLGIVVALAAMAGTWYQGVISREHNELSVKPTLRMIPYLEGEDGRNGIYIANVGLGPAEIVGLKVAVNGKTFDLLQGGSQRKVLQEMGASLLCFSESQPEWGVHVKAGDIEPVFVSTRSRAFSKCHFLIAMTLMKHPLEFEIEYRSAYGNRFVHKQLVHIDSGALYNRLPVPEAR